MKIYLVERLECHGESYNEEAFVLCAFYNEGWAKTYAGYLNKLAEKDEYYKKLIYLDPGYERFCFDEYIVEATHIHHAFKIKVDPSLTMMEDFEKNWIWVEEEARE